MEPGLLTHDPALEGGSVLLVKPGSVLIINQHYTYDVVCDAVIKNFHFEMREISRFIRINQIAADKIAHSIGSPFLPRDASYQFSLSFALPIMIGLKMTDMQRYTNFIRGKDISPLLDVYCSSNFSHHFCSHLLTVKESFEEEPGKKQLHWKKNLQTYIMHCLL